MDKYQIETKVYLDDDDPEVEPHEVVGYKQILGLNYLIFDDGRMMCVERVRNILFKAKRIDNGEWVEGIPIKTHIGTFIVFEENPHYCSQYGYMEIDGLCKIDENTICQYTGLTDKNGKKIFWGDIVLTDDTYNREVRYPGVRYRVEMREGCWVVKTVNKRWRFLNVAVHHGLAVIGNIFDKAKLMENRMEE